MASVNSLISERLKKKDPSPKMAMLAEKSAAGGLSSFQGIFKPTELTPNERDELSDLLEKYKVDDEHDIREDLYRLTSLTSEVKAINHQAALLHGERIQKAQTLLKSYKEGAFTAWLLATYGNRQTPYNLLQYYEFYEQLPQQLRPRLEKMPRQAVYSLASREGDLSKKIQLISDYQGEGKLALLEMIRGLFPLDQLDKRQENSGKKALRLLQDVETLLLKKKGKFSSDQKDSLKEMLHTLLSLVEKR